MQPLATALSSLVLLILCSWIDAELVGVGLVDANTPKINSTLGLIIAAEERNVNLTAMTGVESGTRKIRIYYGIPYAEPATGERRFRPPTPKMAWSNTLVLNATNRVYCPQVVQDPTIQLSEDCLHLNAYVPTNAGATGSLPVMVWFHGGGLVTGSANEPIYDAQYLAANEQVIVFAVNFRVGFTGAFSTDDKVMKGNYNLFDHQLALKWIKENAANFGGDPEKITLFGQSGGAWAVSHHLLNEETKKYFNRGIMQSGSALSPQAISDANVFRDFCTTFAKKNMKCDCADGDNQCLLKCVQQKSFADILKFNAEFYMLTIQADLRINTIVDGDYIKVHPKLLPKTAFSSDKEVMVGLTENECGMILYGYMMTDPDLQGKLDNPPVDASRKYFKAILRAQPKSTKYSESQLDSLEILMTPWTNPESSLLTVKSASKMASRWIFVAASNQEADLYVSNNAKVYYYLLDHVPSSRPLPFPMADWVGSTHGDELSLIFGRVTTGDTAEKKLSRLLMRNWANFARKGDPNDATPSATVPTWPVMRKVEKDYFFYAAGDGKSKAMTGGVERQEAAIFNELMPQLKMAETPKSTTPKPDMGNTSSPTPPILNGTSMIIVAVLAGVVVLLLLILIATCVKCSRVAHSASNDFDMK